MTTLYSSDHGDDLDTFSRASTATYFGHPPDMVPEDVDYYNDFRNGDPRPALGPGLPEFSRAGTRWVWDGEHFVEIAGDIERFSPRDVPGGKVRRMLELALAATGQVPDSVDFSSTSSWSRSNIGSEAVAGSIFEGLPTGGEARTFTSTAGFPNLSQDPGTLTGSKETSVMVVEDEGQTESALGIFDRSSLGWVVRGVYNWSDDSISVQAGSGEVFAFTLSENPKRVLLVVTGSGTVGNGRRVTIYPVWTNDTGESGTVHYADHFEESYAPGVQPAVGSPVAMPAEQFYVSPGPYRSDEVQVGYVAFEAGTLVGDTGTERFIVEHGNDSNPLLRLIEEDDRPGEYDFVFRDASGPNTQISSVDVGSPKPGARVEAVYAFDPSDGTCRLLVRVDGGSWQDSGAGAPGSWTTPTSLGANNQVVYNEDGGLDGTFRGRQFYESHHVVRERRLHNNPFYGAAEDVGAEIAGIFVSPDGAQVVSTGI